MNSSDIEINFSSAHFWQQTFEYIAMATLNFQGSPVTLFSSKINFNALISIIQSTFWEYVVEANNHIIKSSTVLSPAQKKTTYSIHKFICKMWDLNLNHNWYKVVPNTIKKLQFSIQNQFCNFISYSFSKY